MHLYECKAYILNIKIIFGYKIYISQWYKYNIAVERTPLIRFMSVIIFGVIRPLVNVCVLSFIKTHAGFFRC